MKNKTSSLTFVFVGEGIVWEKINEKVGCLVVGWLLTYVSVLLFFAKSCEYTMYVSGVKSLMI
jgi:hypothetical protein